MALVIKGKLVVKFGKYLWGSRSTERLFTTALVSLVGLANKAVFILAIFFPFCPLFLLMIRETGDNSLLCARLGVTLNL